MFITIDDPKSSALCCSQEDMFFSYAEREIAYLEKNCRRFDMSIFSDIDSDLDGWITKVHDEVFSTPISADLKTQIQASLANTKNIYDWSTIMG